MVRVRDQKIRGEGGSAPKLLHAMYSQKENDIIGRKIHFLLCCICVSFFMCTTCFLSAKCSVRGCPNRLFSSRVYPGSTHRQRRRRRPYSMRRRRQQQQQLQVLLEVADKVDEKRKRERKKERKRRESLKAPLKGKIEEERREEYSLCRSGRH
jgi:hypothetical protein